MASIDGFQLEESLKSFRFNELGGISILKKWRELAVICQIDIEIVSISRENYRNYASIPASGFYGYASLVLRDFVLPSIKITQPRQTLYYARNDSAMSNWFTYLQAIRNQENYKGIEALVCFNTGLLGGVCVPKPCKPIPSFRFDEIPLREVIVKADYGTQFVIEYSFWNLLPELDNCGDIITPKSNQRDGNKDRGLPPNGSSPNHGNPNDPYAGLPPADRTDKEGLLSPSELNNQNNPNPDNAPVENGNYGILWGWDQSCRPSGQVVAVSQAIKYADLLPNDLIDFAVKVPQVTCNSDILVTMKNLRTGEFYHGFQSSDGGFLSVGGGIPAFFIQKIDQRSDWLN